MNEEQAGRRRRTFRWPKEARELVRIHLNAQRLRPQGLGSNNDLRVMVTKLAEASGNPRERVGDFSDSPELWANEPISSGPNGHDRGYWT